MYKTDVQDVQGVQDGSMANVLTLADVLSRRLSLRSYEAVSIVREVADRMTEKLHEVLLSEVGQVSVVCATRTDEPVRRLGQLLQALLAESASPVQLRLVISQAPSPAPAYRSIHELSPQSDPTPR